MSDLDPLPPSPQADDDASLTARTRTARLARQEEKILYDKANQDAGLPPERKQGGFQRFLDETGKISAFAGHFFSRFWRRPFEARELFKQMDEVGTKSFVLVGVVGFSIGLVLAMQSRGTLARFGAEAFLPGLLTLSVVKEIGPVLTSLVLAGRLGAGFSSELGSMRVTEQIDALEVAALKPFHYLVVTRVLACVIMFPIMTMLADVLALTGGYIESYLSAGTDLRVFVVSGFQTLRFVDLFMDTFKTSIFGFIVGVVSCYKGYNVRGGTREVGQAAMQAVVLSSLLILLADVIVVRLSILLFGDISG